MSEKKFKGMGDEKSERLHSTDDAGEPFQGTRTREGGRRVREPVEGKKAEQSNPRTFYTGLDWVAELSRRRPEMVFNTLAHHIDEALLLQAWSRTRKSGAPGVDGVTAQEYGEALQENLADLLVRLKSGRYRAPSVKRVRIPKGDGSSRPIGIPTLEDKVLQRAVTMVLESIYEQDFRDCSHGFRPRRDCHSALDALWNATMSMGGGVVVEVDIKGFFDNLDHGHLRRFLDGRVRDGVIRRAIDKWLNAGVLDGGAFWRPEKGTPQGGVISPLLANIYLHHVLDTWFEDEIKPRLGGRSFLARYADDFVMVFEKENDARRVMEVLPKRFGKYGLTLHPDKTRTVPFYMPQAERSKDDDAGGPGTFTLLGFTHYWGLSKKGNWVIRKKTAKTSMTRSLRKVATWLLRYRHMSVRRQFDALCLKLRGHYGYFGVTGNSIALATYRWRVYHLWRRALARRSQNGRMTWERFTLSVVNIYVLPWPKVVRSVYRNAARL